MDPKAFDLAEEINNRRVEYTLHSGLWNNFNYPKLDLKISKWKKLKYLDDSGSKFNRRVDYIPSDKGGLYLFFIKCDILKGITQYPLYIGRAQYTSSQNLKKRIKEYFQKYSNNTERPKIYRMFKYWAKDLYLAYFPIAKNSTIVNLERDLINSLMLPMNSDIPDKTIKTAIKAFK
jgi:hypothetical protein